MVGMQVILVCSLFFLHFIFVFYVSYKNATKSENLEIESENNLKICYTYNMKMCNKCKKTKKYSDFHKYSKSPDGYKHFCKSCVREYDQTEDDAKRVMPRKKQGDLIHCRRCEKYLSKTSFWSNNTYCRECTVALGHINNLKNYGLTRDDYVNMEKSQNGICKICGESEKYNKRLSVDHDHSCCSGITSCGKCIRGLLCSNCNRVLGQVNDNKILLQKMIKYLK
jgi:hypothetical protein